jgi:hypothetical protein
MSEEKDDCPIERLQFFSDERLKECERFEINSVKCPLNNKLSMEVIEPKDCEECCKKRDEK